MGLGTVELVMEIEDKFSVRIPDEDAERLETPADVADWLMAHISRSTEASAACSTARIFYDIRGDLISQFGVERRVVKPSARLAELVPTQSGTRWRQFRRKHNLPRRRLMDLLGDRPANPELTVRDVVDLSSLSHESQWFDSQGKPIREKILTTVRWITSVQAGVTFNEIKPDTHFVRDLQLD